MRGAVVASLAVAAAATPPETGSFNCTSKKYTALNGYIGTKGALHVWHPTGTTDHFPLIVYAHGADGGKVTGYNTFFERIASFGFIVAAPMGAPDTGPRGKPDKGVTGKDVQKAVAFCAKSTDFSVDTAAGVGVAGHLHLGGNAVGECSAEPLASQIGVKAVMHQHSPCEARIAGGPIKGTTPGQVAVPIAFYTGTKDKTCELPDHIPDPTTNIRPFCNASCNNAEKYYDNVTFKPKLMRNQIGMNHLEPMLEGMGQNENPYFGYFTAAWFKVFLAADKAERDQYHEVIYGNGTDSLCAHAPMEKCENIV